MKKFFFPIGLILASVSAAAVNVGGVEVGNPWFYLEKAFTMLKDLIVTDVSRIIITYILLFVIFSRVLITAIKKTPFKESANIISNAIAGIIIIAMFYRTRGFLDRFSWAIIIIGVIVILWRLIGRFIQKLMRRNYSSFRRKEKSVKNDKRRERHEENDIEQAQDLTDDEERLNRNESRDLHSMDSSEEEKLVRLLQELTRRGNQR